MSKFNLNVLLFILSIALTACSGDSTQTIDYSLAPVESSGLNMKAAIYQAILPSGNTLTITTDQSGTNIYGAYTIKNGSTIISSGTVSNSVFQFTLVGHKYFGSPCPNEAITIIPSNINTARNEADISISGQSSCSESLSPLTTSHISKPATANMSSRGMIGGDNQELALSVVSGDNVNFVGSVTLYNNTPSLSISATGTIIGTTTDSGAGPVTGPDISPVVEIKYATGLFFTGIRNSSGNFFDVSSNITNITGQVLTSTWGNQSFIRDIIISGVKDGTPIQQLGPISNITSSQSYSPL